MKLAKVLFLVSLPIIFIASIVLYVSNHNAQVFNTAGTIAKDEKSIILFSMFLSLFVLVPVYLMLIIFSVKYRESNKSSKYSPNFSHSKAVESVWWGIPTILIIILSVVTWRSSHQLDPYKMIDSNIKPINIQVVALDWKWLFIYPDESIATINTIDIPINTPVNFELTSDAPMNSFWVPQLSGQIYTMPGMSTKLSILSDKKGSYSGRSANISGKGFAGMLFSVNVVSNSEYNNWIKSTKSSTKVLNDRSYETLSKPTENVQPFTYSFVSADLYKNILGKYTLSDNNMSKVMGM
jgi:cytochrome o ubiquinol oxidase subunit 2